jgi:hypothetical protein
MIHDDESKYTVITSIMAAADEVEDYMSLSFLVEDKEVTKKKKHGTISSTNTNNTNTNKQQRKKQRRFCQQEHMDANLRTGLNKPIEASNKGFKLLEKFGFKKEEGGLGKFGTGIQEPIQVRSQVGPPTNLGIGKEKSLLQVQDRIKEELVKHQNKIASLETNFRHSLKNTQECKQLRRDSIQAEKVIEQLDQRADVARHELWPPQLESDQQDADTANEVESAVEIEIERTDSYPQLLHNLELRLVVSDQEEISLHCTALRCTADNYFILFFV